MKQTITDTDIRFLKTLGFSEKEIKTRFTTIDDETLYNLVKSAMENGQKLSRLIHELKINKKRVYDVSKTITLRRHHIGTINKQKLIEFLNVYPKNMPPTNKKCYTFSEFKVVLFRHEVIDELVSDMQIRNRMCALKILWSEIKYKINKDNTIPP